MSRLISPPAESFSELRQPLTKGELLVFEMFNDLLAPGWEIYLQPHLNGLRPDFVVLNPEVGIGVFEVKDWDLGAMRYFTESDHHGRPVLMGERDGRQFSLQSQNPVTKVEGYKQSIYNLYCPRLAQTNGYGAITAGVIFPYARRASVRRLFSPFIKNTEGDKFAKYNPISGMEEIDGGDIAAVFPESRRDRSYLMSDAHAADLRGWLVEPDFSSTQRLPLELDPIQKNLVGTWPTSGYRRIKGPAGSGKSLVLAARAAHRAREKKSVLVVTFNITLWHYLKDLVVRARPGRGGMQMIRFDHFHLFCRRVTEQAEMGNDYLALFEGFSKKSKAQQDEIVLVRIPELAKSALTTGLPDKFDTILVDEGQDYQPEWWNILRMALAPDGEMLLVADITQDVYGTGKAWTEDAMTGMGFAGGKWAHLRIGYRMPPLVQDQAREFARRYLPNETADLPDEEQQSLAIDPCQLRWVQCSEQDGVASCVAELLALMRQTGSRGIANADITFLCDDTKVGAIVSEELGRRHIATAATFGRDYAERRREKMGLYMGRAEVKATSLHSFKGWESRTLVVYVSQAWSPESKALIYAALTRVKRSPEGSWITVVCAATELTEYGKTWPDFTLGLEGEHMPTPISHRP